MRRKNKLYFASISILQTGLNSHLYEKCILLWTTLFQLLHVKLWFFEDLIKVLFWPLEIRFIFLLLQKFNSFCLFFFILIFFFQVCSSTGFPYKTFFYFVIHEFSTSSPSRSAVPSRHIWNSWKLSRMLLYVVFLKMDVHRHGKKSCRQQILPHFSYFAIAFVRLLFL